MEQYCGKVEQSGGKVSSVEQYCGTEERCDGTVERCGGTVEQYGRTVEQCDAIKSCILKEVAHRLSKTWILPNFPPLRRQHCRDIFKG